MAKTDIEWTGESWNPIRARNLKTKKLGHFCKKVSPGCKFCYAEGINRVWGTGLLYKAGHQKDVEIFLDEKVLLAPLKWKDDKVFVCSMTDLFADFVKTEWIDAVFAVMYLSDNLIFQVLTKRSVRMREYMQSPRTRVRVLYKANQIMLADSSIKPFMFPPAWPPANAWMGVSIEDRRQLARLHDLERTPARLRWVSFEPLLEILAADGPWHGAIDWAVIGLESRGGRWPGLGPVTALINRLGAAGTPVFVKQLGTAWARKKNQGLKRGDPRRVHGKGGKMAEWPKEFQVRQFPERRAA